MVHFQGSSSDVWWSLRFRYDGRTCAGLLGGETCGWSWWEVTSCWRRPSLVWFGLQEEPEVMPDVPQATWTFSMSCVLVQLQEEPLERDCAAHVQRRWTSSQGPQASPDCYDDSPTELPVMEIMTLLLQHEHLHLFSPSTVTTAPQSS